MVRRHEVLRTSFHDLDGRPVQVIPPALLSRACAVTDLGGLAEAEREAEVTRVAEEESRPPLRSRARAAAARQSAPPLRRESTCRSSPCTTCLRRLVCECIVREVSALYRAFSNGEPSPLEELPVQYADYAAGSARGCGARRSNICSPTGSGSWPARRPRSNCRRTGRAPPRGASTAMRSRCSSEGVDRAAEGALRRQNATLFMALLAAFASLLHRHTGRTTSSSAPRSPTAAARR